MANINNIKTGNVNIPGALHSTANDGGGQIGNVVAYTGDIYDTTAGKNLATLNAEFAEGIANAGGGGTGTITGATVGGAAVTESNGVLQFDAYPTANTMQYSSSTSYTSGTIGKEVKDLNTSVSNLSAQVAELDKPSPTPSPSTTVVNLANYTTSGSSFTYDVDNKYTYNTKDTTFYQYSEENNNTTVYYGVFKVIGEDKYLMYSITNNTTFTYVNTYTESALPENAKKEFALGSVAVVKRVNGEGERWKNGTVNLFCTKQNMALRNRCRNINFNGSTAWRVLIKSEDGNTIFVYKAKSNGNYEWEINVPRSSTANFNLLDKYFDRPEASSVSFDDSVTQLGTQNDPVTDVQAAINQLATGIQGLTGKLKIHLLYQNSTPVANKEVSISAYYRGTSYDISSQYSPSTEGFKTDSDGYVINNNSNEYLVLPLGATYTITLYDISDNYITPEVKNGIIDANTVTVNCIYNNVSDIEFVKVYVQTPNTPITIANVENKKVYVDFYASPTSTVHTLQYVCLLRANGTIKQIFEADGNTQATYNGEPLTSNSEPVLIPVPNGTKYTCALQEWDETISSENQRYVKSANQTYTAKKAKRSLTFTYTDKQLGLFLLVKDSTQAKGYRSCLITEINSTTNFKIKDETQNESVSYIITRSNSNVYRQVEGDSNQELWEEEILGVGVRTSQSVFESNDDLETQSEYPDCSFFVPINVIAVSGMQMLNEDTTKVSLPDNYGGLYLTKCLYNLGPSPTSPAAHKLIDETTFDIVLQTPNNNKTIKGFIPTSPQALIVRGCLSNFNNIWNIIKGSGFSIQGSQSAIWTCTNGNVVMYNNSFVTYSRSSISTTNPSAIVGTVLNVLFAIYPF